MSLRDVTIAWDDETGDKVRVTSRTGSAQRILGNLKKVKRVEGSCQNGCVKGSGSRPVIPQSAATDLLWQTCVKQPALTHTPSPPRGRERKDATKVNFLNYSNHSWIKTTAIFFLLPSSLSISFSVDFFLYSTKRWSYGTQRHCLVQISCVALVDLWYPVKNSKK